MDGLSKVFSSVVKPFKVRFLSTKGAKIMETDNGIGNLSIASGIFRNFHLTSYIATAQARDFTTSWDRMNALVYLVSLLLFSFLYL